MTCRCTLLVSCFLSTILLSLQLLLQLWLEWMEETNLAVPYLATKRSSLKEVNEVVLVWWTPFTGNPGSTLECGKVKCFVTQDRRFQHHPKLQMYLFYGSNLDIFDLPLPKSIHKTWSLLHEESPKNVPLLSHREGISLFNYTSTFSRYSDVPLTLQYLPSIASISDKRFVVPLKLKNDLLDHLSPVLYIQSDCDTPLDRDKYVQALMNYVSVDSYGICLHNKKLPSSLTNSMETINSDEFLKFVARYKFTIAIENAICEDYITEKLWRPLIVGSVPIYMGSPSVEDWLPNPNSAVLVSNFKTPEELGAFILDLNANDTKYSEYLSHKEGKITNNHFLSEMLSRPWGPPDGNEYHFIDHFECQMCIQAHMNANGHTKQKIAAKAEYNCPKPRSSITGHEDLTNPWLFLWQYGKCEASVLQEKIQEGSVFINQSAFQLEVDSKLKEGLCF